MVALAAITATLSIARVNAPSASPGPIVLTAQRRSRPDTDAALVRLAIDPPPVILPRITYTIAGDPSIAVTERPPHWVPSATGVPSTPPGEVYVVGGRTAHAVLTAHVGPPYDTNVSADIFSYGSIDLGCSPGESPALAVDATGAPIASRDPEHADVYVALSPAAGNEFFCRAYPQFVDPALTDSMMRFPLGAVTADVPPSSFDSVSARDWKNATTEVRARGFNGVWLIRSRSGATIKLMGEGQYAVAPPNGEFPDHVARLTPVVRVVLHASAARSH